MHRRWYVNKTNPEFVGYLSRSASISRICAQVLINRGIKTPSSVSEFLNPSASGLEDPFSLPGMKAAVERLGYAASAGERVLVHGDYDADGVTATAIMVRTLRHTGIDAEYFVPNRLAHGYGFNQPGVDRARELGAKLILTVDCGISSFAAATAARASGIDVIITDHHEPTQAGACSQGGGVEDNGFIVPEAIAVINPKLRPGSSTLVHLSGAGIAFKVAHAIALTDGLRFSMDELLPLLDLAALGTVADVVPLTGENRIMIREGLRYIDSAVRPGIRALKSVSNLEARSVRAGLLAFTMVPRINAAGRVADSGDVVRLLLTETEDEAGRISMWLDTLNTERQRIEGEVYQEARAKVDPAAMDTVIVLAGERWHPGVLGIVASKIADEFGRPAFIFSIDNGIAKGSARSIPSFDICRGLTECSGLLLTFGGHRQAAGVKLESHRLAEFEAALGGIARRMITEEALTPSIEIDAVVALSDITMTLAGELERLEPFGFGNPEPLLGARSLEVLNPKIVGNNHLKMRLKRDTTVIDSIAFDMGTSFGRFDSPERIDAVFTPSIHEWKGGRYLQLVVKALRPGS
ncbi:MAG: single-stranded-DNA-specific exonuclease RecJ [Nitrospiraceae bacterium]|nr:single-stranded-DNA-specific exonuclease RecJ [Nitrospiraceae bacterium]